MRFARSLFSSALLSSALLLSVGCSSASNGSNNTPVVDDDTGTPSDDTGTPSDDTTPGDDTAPPALTYPSGPYGLKPGMVFPNIQFNGYKNGTGDWGPMTMLNYYDPDGSRGINGIYLVIAAQWCGPCNMEADHLPHWWTDDYSTRGGQFVSIVYQQQNGKQAIQLTADQWIAKHHINFDIGIDDSNSAIPTGSFGLPHNYIINPRDMKVFRTVDGIDPNITTGCTSDASCCNNDPTNCPGSTYKCSPTLKTCIVPTTTGPVPQLEYILKVNGSSPFDLGFSGP